MGKITSETQGVTTNHFSHHHPLTLINHQPQQTQTIQFSCSGCNHQPSGLIYTCTTCPFFLHKKCFEMPKKITHPCHNLHPLTLLPKPVYHDGLFKCDACDTQGNGFSYHCSPCGVDLHVNCAIMPLSITHAFHAHPLHLTFRNPYGVMGFCCEICKMNGNGSNHWLYRCVACGFDAHLKCASSQAQVRPLHNHQNGVMHNNVQSQQVRSIPQPMQQQVQVRPLHNHQNSVMHNNVQAQQVRSIPQQMQQQQQFRPQAMVNNTNDVFNQAYRQQMAINNNALSQAFGGNAVRQLAQLACGGLDVVGLLGGGSGLNLNGLVGGGGGGGGLDINGLAGGGGGLDVNGLSGGGGGLDLGGMVGGAGGMDMSGLFGG